ncbi:unnamed protein product [Pedinophyceae sp. YPF-701]|nr:unnamed protein product [Pedinophyceae sp. YPF-701]
MGTICPSAGARVAPLLRARMLSTRTRAMVAQSSRSAAPGPAWKQKAPLGPGTAPTGARGGGHTVARSHGLSHPIQNEVLTYDDTSMFPFRDDFSINGKSIDADAVIGMMSRFMSEERMERIRRVADLRTFSVVPVLEGCHDLGNMAAVARSADALGFGAMHVIHNEGNKFKQTNRVSRGSEKWVRIQAWGESHECLTHLKEIGYRVLVTHLSENTMELHDVDWSIPTAVVLGNEHDGVTPEALALADGSVKIPMVGMVESFNISVAAALVLYEARQSRIDKLGCSGDLTDEQKRVLHAVMALRHRHEGVPFLEAILHRAEEQGVLVMDRRRRWQIMETGEKKGYAAAMRKLEELGTGQPRNNVR